MNVPFEEQEPQIIEVEGQALPLEIHFKSSSSRIKVRQSHESAGAGEVEETSSDEEPHRLIHTVNKPIISEVREIITPFRKVIQVSYLLRRRFRFNADILSPNRKFNLCKRRSTPSSPSRREVVEDRAVRVVRVVVVEAATMAVATEVPAEVRPVASEVPAAALRVATEAPAVVLRVATVDLVVVLPVATVDLVAAHPVASEAPAVVRPVATAVDQVAGALDLLVVTAAVAVVVVMAEARRAARRVADTRRASPMLLMSNIIILVLRPSPRSEYLTIFPGHSC